MREKTLMASFFIGNMMDSAITTVGMSQQGFLELGMAGRLYYPAGESISLHIAKSVITAAIIAGYALSKKYKPYKFAKWEYVFDRALKIGSAVVWGVNAWNLFNIGLYVAAR